MSNICGPGKGPCPADLGKRMDKLEEQSIKLAQHLIGLSTTFGKMHKQFKRAIKERHHVQYHRLCKPPNPDDKICPTPTAPPPCSVLLRSDDIEELCCRFKQLWPQLAQVMAERSVWKMENEKLKRRLSRLKEKYEPGEDDDPLKKNKKRC